MVILELDGYAEDPDISGYITAYDVARHENKEVTLYRIFLSQCSVPQLYNDINDDQYQRLQRI